MTIEDIVDEIPFNFQFFNLFILTSIRAFCELYCSTFSILAGSVIPTSLPKTAASLLIKSSFFAGMIFSFIPTSLLKNYSPRNEMLILATIAFLTNILYLFNLPASLLTIANFSLGINYGALAIASFSLSVSTVNKTLRPILFTWASLFYPVGGILACVTVKYSDVLNDPTQTKNCTLLLPILV